MRILVILVWAWGMSPAVAAVYKCTPDGRTVYQDVPCANAVRIESINALPPSPPERLRALERAAGERELAAQLRRDREAEAARAAAAQADARRARARQIVEPEVVVTRTLLVPVAAPAWPHRQRPRHHRHYERPEQYHDRQDHYYSPPRRPPHRSPGNPARTRKP